MNSRVVIIPGAPPWGFRMGGNPLRILRVSQIKIHLSKKWEASLRYFEILSYYEYIQKYIMMEINWFQNQMN